MRYRSLPGIGVYVTATLAERSSWPPLHGDRSHIQQPKARQHAGALILGLTPCLRVPCVAHGRFWRSWRSRWPYHRPQWPPARPSARASRRWIPCRLARRSRSSGAQAARHAASWHVRQRRRARCKPSLVPTCAGSPSRGSQFHCSLTARRPSTRALDLSGRAES